MNRALACCLAWIVGTACGTTSPPGSDNGNLPRVPEVSDDCIDTGCPPNETCSDSGVCLDAGTCEDDDHCPDGTICDVTSGLCTPGSECGSVEAKASGVPANVLLVLDRSCSMERTAGDKPKWTIAVEAVGALTQAYEGQIHFGLALFPDIDELECEQGELTVALGGDSGPVIRQVLNDSLNESDDLYPDGPCVTNIDSAMQQAAAGLALVDSSSPSSVVLITDGNQSGCGLAGGDAGTEQIIADLLQTRSVTSFVLGFGDGVDPEQLSIFANAGGTASADPSASYYKAEDHASFSGALDAIARQALGCALRIDEKPPSGDFIHVFFDNEIHPQDRDRSRVEGWDYDEATQRVLFFGRTCDALRAGAVAEVDVVFGCYYPPA